MKTSIIVQNLKRSECAKTIIAKLSEFSTISHLSVDVELAKVSFIYENFNDALAVKEKLKTLGYPSIRYKSSISNKRMSLVHGGAVLKLAKS